MGEERKQQKEPLTLIMDNYNLFGKEKREEKDLCS
jgi:hypothetical protein